jgi:hypothetical protein
MRLCQKYQVHFISDAPKDMNQTRVDNSSQIDRECRFELDRWWMFANGIVKALMLAHPHNPLGRCYSREVLVKLMRLCQKYQVDNSSQIDRECRFELDRWWMFVNGILKDRKRIDFDWNYRPAFGSCPLGYE